MFELVSDIMVNYDLIQIDTCVNSEKTALGLALWRVRHTEYKKKEDRRYGKRVLAVRIDYTGFFFMKVGGGF